MSRKHNLTVKGGRLRIKCERCETVRYYTVLSHMRRKTVRCSLCGKAEHLILNRRKYRRKSCITKATVVNATRRTQVNLSDMSQTGIGFGVSKAARVFKINQKIIIEYKTFSGKNSIRKACVMNISASHVGAQYSDSLL